MISLLPFQRFFSLFKSDSSSSLKKQSSLTFVGLGPGDPDLLTIAAVNAINDANLVAYPVAYKGSKSIAREIAIDLIKNKKSLPILLPMVTDNQILNKAWANASNQLLEAIDSYGKVVFVCQGDPSLYSTSAYLLYYIKHSKVNIEIKVIPGITSFTAAAAKCQLPLSLQKEDLIVKTVPDEPQELKQLLDKVTLSNQVLVLLKLGPKWLWVREILKKKNLLEETFFAHRIGFHDELLVKAGDVNINKVSYFSLLIIRKSPDYIFS